MNFTARSDGGFDLGGIATRCALGRAGVIAAHDKREGDGASPAGAWPIRRVLYRPDRLAPPQTALPFSALARDDGWCDAPLDPNYNRQVTLPYPASAEPLWRHEAVYNLIVVLGHNDAPPVPMMGSAIFLHLAQPDYSPTQGCVALSLKDMERLLALAKPGSSLVIENSRNEAASASRAK